MTHLFKTDMSNLSLPGGYRYGIDQTIVNFNTAVADPTRTVYVGYGNDEHARYGSIGIAVPKGCDPNDRSNWPPYQASNLQNRYHTTYSSIHPIDVHWDAKHKSEDIYIHSSKLFWLTAYQGPTKWVFTKKAKEEKQKVIAYDKLNNEVQVGDFVTFVGRTTYGSGKGDLMFGFVERISNAGIMFCKNIKLSDADHVREWRVAKGDQVSKLNKEILTQLMLRRLTF